MSVSLLDTRALPGGADLPAVNGRSASAGTGLPQVPGLPKVGVLPNVTGASQVLPGTKVIPQAQDLAGKSAPVRAGARRVRPDAKAPGTISVPAKPALPVDVPGRYKSEAKRS
ncbi:hypothetical protein GCM10023178_77930 [Actinomadura luteofluorescens]